MKIRKQAAEDNMVDDARVLIVDDDEVVISIITSILKREKYITDSCYSG